MKTAKVLVSEHALPSDKNGSWTQRMEFFLRSSNNVFNYVICSPSKKNIHSTANFKYRKTIQNKLLLKLNSSLKYKYFLDELNTISKEYDFVVLCVVDNVKLQLAINSYLNKNQLYNKFHVIFYNCGFSYYLSNSIQQNFMKNINEVIFLTKSAYLFNKEKHQEFIPEVSILNNPIDKTIYFPPTSEDKVNLLQKYKLENKIVYLWLSHDRPKKGLSIILKAWQSWGVNKKNVHLLVVGASKSANIESVTFLGKIPSNQVHEYYKLSHIYLFPTLWKEGFGLSLSQAICSGCYCIAASNGGVSDYFLANDGMLIESPNIVSEWVSAFDKGAKTIQNNWNNNNCGEQILSFEEWASIFAGIINKSEKRLNN